MLSHTACVAVLLVVDVTTIASLIGPQIYRICLKTADLLAAVAMEVIHRIDRHNIFSYRRGVAPVADQFPISELLGEVIEC